MEAVTNLTQTFRACHLRTFNVAAIFFRDHPYIWRTTVRHDNVVLMKVCGVGFAVKVVVLC